MKLHILPVFNKISTKLKGLPPPKKFGSQTAYEFEYCIDLRLFIIKPPYFVRARYAYGFPVCTYVLYTLNINFDIWDLVYRLYTNYTYSSVNLYFVYTM